MKCPHCYFEREETFKFCPKCGTRIETQITEVSKVSEQTNQQNEVLNDQIQPNLVVNKIPRGFTENTYNEKKGIKKLSRLTGCAFLALSIIPVVVSYCVLLGLMLLGMSYEKVANLFDDPFFQQYYQIVVSSFMFIVPFTLFFKLSKHKISKLVNFSLPKTKIWFPVVLMGVGFCAFANIANNISAAIFEGFGVNYEVDFGENPKGISGFILAFLATAVVPALVEEFACRGIVLGSLKKYGEGFAIMVSSIMFGLIHGNFQQIPFAFLVGLILGFVTVKTGSIWPAVFIHFNNNFTSVAFDYFFNDILVTMQNIIYTIYLSICLFVGMLGLLLIAKDNEIFKLSNGGTESTEKQKYKWFFTTAVTILVVITCLYESLQYFVS